MKLTKISLLFVWGIMFFGCAESDTSAPSILKDEVYSEGNLSKVFGDFEPSPSNLYSAFDTIAITFDDNLDEFSEDNYNATPDLDFYDLSTKKYIFYGKDKYNGVRRMEANKKHEIEFSGLVDDNGNKISENIVFEFETMPLLDSDINGGDNDDVAHADTLADSLRFFNEDPMDDGIYISGILTGQEMSDADMSDVYRILARADDSLTICLFDMKVDLDLEFKGPRAVDADDKEFDTSENGKSVSENTGLKNELIQIRLEANRHIYGTTNMEEYLEYWVVVRYPNGVYTDATNAPYKLYLSKN